MTDATHSGVGAPDTGAFGKKRKSSVRPFPRLPLFAAFTLVGFALLLAVIGQQTDIGTVRAQFGEPVAMRDIAFHKQDGQFAVVDVASGRTIAEMDDDGKGFVFGALRGLERVRMVREIPVETPYRIIKWQNGWLSLSDTGTGERIYLDAFGQDNVAAFERFLNDKEPAK